MDREKAFVSKEVRGWMSQKGLYCTYTAGDEPCGNARAEREIGVLRGRCRALMKSTRLDPSLWALAFRHAGEERLRSQLWQLGVTTPPLLPFGARAMVKKKAWFQRGDPWKWPMTPVTVLGPAGDMSITSGGYYCRDDEGRFLRSTVVVIPKQQATTAQALEDEMRRLQQPEALLHERRGGRRDRDGVQHPGEGEDSPGGAEEVNVENMDVDLGGDPDNVFGPMEEPRLLQGGQYPEPYGAEDIFEAFRVHGQSAQVTSRISQSAHEDGKVSQSAHADGRISQSAHEDSRVSQSVPEGDKVPDETIPEAELQERQEGDVLVVMDPPTRRIWQISSWTTTHYSQSQLLSSVPCGKGGSAVRLEAMTRLGMWRMTSRSLNYGNIKG